MRFFTRGEFRVSTVTSGEIKKSEWEPVERAMARQLGDNR